MLISLALWTLIICLLPANCALLEKRPAIPLGSLAINTQAIPTAMSVAAAATITGSASEPFDDLADTVDSLSETTMELAPAAVSTFVEPYITVTAAATFTSTVAPAQLETSSCQPTACFANVSVRFSL